MKNLISALYRVAIVTLATFPAFVLAAPTSGPYVTDPQNEYVHDATSDSIGSVNNILCILKAMNIGGSKMLNQGPYIALIDMNKCKSSGGSSDASGASATANYSTAIIDATRSNNSTDPMIANIWLSMTEQGKQMNISVRLSASKSPTEVPPYGEFRLDYIGKDSNDIVQFNGYIDSTSGSLKYLESNPTRPQDSTAMSLTPGLTTATGSGTVAKDLSTPPNYATTYNFNYNTDYFRRSDAAGGANDRCFDRLKANAAKSVWRYGTYKDSDGSRVDQANPGFPITATYGGISYYGYASYYGLGFQGLDLNTIADANPIPNLTINDQRPGNSATYNLSKVGGKLTKWTRNNTRLSAMDGIPFLYYGDLSGAKTTGGFVTTFAQWQMQWDDTAANFTVTGTQTCDTKGCSLTTISPPATVNAGVFSTTPINGWSDSFGGSVSIPSTTADHVGTDAVLYFSQSTVMPGTTPLTLNCLNNCPDAASIAATTTGYVSGTVSPFNSTTTTQWGYALNATGATITYSFDSTGLNISATPMINTNAAYYANNTQYQWGVMTGRLFASPLESCLSATAVCEPTNTDYYTWSTGLGQWNQSMWLTKTSDSSVVAFDPPQNIAYTVPNDLATYGTWANRQIQLQFNGFGNLYGIPGYCVNPVDNQVVDCGPNTRYVPMFSLADGTTMTLNGTTLIVKALDGELRLKDLGLGATVCPSLTLTSLPPPVGGTHDMTNAADAYYIGSKPAITSSPKVIDGIVQ